jgi:hypothetical protein
MLNQSHAADVIHHPNATNGDITDPGILPSELGIPPGIAQQFQALAGARR